MRSFTLITALFLCCTNWICVSVSETQTVEVQPGQEVSLLCSNISRKTTQTDWFRLVNRTKVSCVSSIYNPEDKPSYCDGSENRFEMSSNVTTVFLKIKRVDLSDSGLYFCGFYMNENTIIGCTTHLKVQDNGESDDEADCQTETENEEKHPGRKNLGSDDLNSAALRFLPETIRNRKPASPRQVETHVIYNVSR
ncbi:uncharacterized protein LOC121177260 isoform X2 [Toxotes jaculatrix]|uniref:uncharacterized protein LOC121177260 isoform X2 n=1 Tax=Toxotes jaculatrix TaxID=941984 RepID=UPI001B3AA85A|nr:uncharacterized protein LOC121177260 isoform X2 [Toxotes jaculatrix]